MKSGFSLFGRHLALSIAITCLFVLALGSLSFWTIHQLQRETPFSPPAVTYAKILKSVEKEKRPEALERINENDPNSHFQFWLFDKNGQVIFPQQGPNRPSVLPINFGKIVLPEKLFDFRFVERKEGAPSSFTVVQIDADPPQYLLVKAQGRGNGRRIYYINFISQFLSVILGTTISLFILFYFLRQKAALADSVISELQRGNLKARFPITKMDEIGEAMLRFNKMADEIERLVERLKTTEKSRMSILTELAHDLRTPVSSLKSMLETLSTRDESMTPELKTELTALSLNEVDYFAHLVEDLLFLAQASEPKYNSKAEPFNLKELIETEIESVEKSGATAGNKIAVEAVFQSATNKISGDPHLLRRLIRNALENAVAFASHKVLLKIANPDIEHIEILIQDDGQGFSIQALKEFGRKKLSRKLDSPSSQRRASIGLGSVIMSTVVALHRGEISATNLADPSGKVLGAQVRVILPLT